MVKPLKILLVEDNSGYVRLIEEAFRENEVLNEMRVAVDGMEALAHLRQEGIYARVPRPDLILLDLNLPKKNGKEVLIEIKNDISLRSIPVIIMTTSNLDRDILESYDLHANCLIIKPMDLEQFVATVKSIVDFWFTTARLPPGE